MDDLIAALRAARHVPADENTSAHLAIRLALGWRDERVPLCVADVGPRNLTHSAHAMALQCYDDIIAYLNPAQIGSRTEPAVVVVARRSVEGEAPRRVPTDRNTLVPIAPVPHTGVLALHAVDLPECRHCFSPGLPNVLRLQRRGLSRSDTLVRCQPRLRRPVHPSAVLGKGCPFAH